MSTADNIIQKIMEEAGLTAQENVEKAKAQADEIIRSAQEEANSIKTNIINKAKKDAAASVDRNKGIAALEAGKIRLFAKQDLISSVIENAKKRVLELSSSELTDLYLKMILSMDVDGEEEIIFTEEDRNKLGEGFCDKVNNELKKTGIKGDMKFGTGKLKSGPGFVLRSGKIEINNTFDSIIKMKYSEIEELIVRELF